MAHEPGHNGAEGIPEEQVRKVRLGGMALRNGLLVHGPEHWAIAVRTGDGSIKVDSGRKPRLRGPLADLPGVRGVARLSEAFALLPLIKRQVPEVRLPFEDGRMIAAMLASSLLSAGVRRGGRTAGREGVLTLLGIAPAALALKDSELAAYHGVEHKAIAAYEEDGDAADALKEHDRCGSHLVAPMLATATFGNVAARRAGLRGPAAEAAVGVGSAAVAVEVFAWSERHPDSALTRLLRRPGHEIQRAVGTREPTSEQLEVGRAALAEILRVEPAPAQPDR